MDIDTAAPTIRLGLPKGRMEEGLFRLLRDAGIEIRATNRAYRPTLSLPGFEAKLLKPQNIVEMLSAGLRDIGFTGVDWIVEKNAELIELLDTGLNPVRVVAAAPESLLVNGKLPNRRLVVASEYEQLARDWIKRRELNAIYVHSYGATEVFPPEDADVIIDNTATGSTLVAHGLRIVDEILRSSTRLYASPAALEVVEVRESVERFVLLLKSVLNAQSRVMVEINISADELEKLISILPSMRHPTISPLWDEKAYAVKAAVPRALLPSLIPEIKAQGGTDIVVTPIVHLVS